MHSLDLTMLSMVKGKRLTITRRGPTKKVWRRIYLKEWREYRGLTVEALAEKARVSPALISLIENRKSAGSPDTLEKLADALRISVGELLDIKPETGGSVFRTWVRDADRGRLGRMVDALKDTD